MAVVYDAQIPTCGLGITWRIQTRMFEPGFFISGLLIGLREGVEAALIVAIILAYLARTGNARYFGRIWLGVGAAVVLSVGIGVGLFATIGGLQEPYEQIFEALALLVATAVLLDALLDATAGGVGAWRAARRRGSRLDVGGPGP